MKHRTGHLFKRGSNFYVCWRVNGKLFMRALRDENGLAITTKREAEEARVKLMAPFAVADEAQALESLTGQLQGRKAELAKYDEQQNPPLSIVQGWSSFLASTNRPDSGPETLYQYECQWSAFTDWMKEQHPDKHTLRDVSREIAAEYAGHLNHGKLSANTYNKHLSLLTLVFRVLRDKAKLTENVWEGIQRKRLVTHSRRELTIDELRTVCQSAKGELRILLALGIYSGLRLGDCATLRWCEVDLPRGIIRRVPNKTARRNPRPVIVPLHPVLRDMLAETPQKKQGEYVLPDMAALYANRIDLVTDRVQSHFKACGINLYKTTDPKADNGRAVLEVGFHSLRHTFVSLCRESNAPLAVVESIVGHSNPAMTRHYTHVGELAASNAVAMLPAVIGDAPKPGPVKLDADTLRAKIKAIVQGLNGKNWVQKRATLIHLIS